jgi:hypothetical protein
VRCVIAVALAVALAACKSGASTPSGEGSATVRMSADEERRGRDACKAYLAQVCACADRVPALVDECRLARGGPEAVQLGLDIAAGSETTKQDALGALASVRKTVKRCIEQTAKLASSGCL